MTSPERPERVIRWFGWADGQVRAGDPAEGDYLRSFDVDAEPNGTWEFTSNPAEALVFPTSKEAFAAWTARSTRLPTRPDGRPNKPLTAFNALFDPAPDEAVR